MTKRLILVGGSAGSEKTTPARQLADDLGAGWLQLDTVWTAMKAAVRDPRTSSRLDVAARMVKGESEQEVLAAQLVADGAWLLPSFVAGVALHAHEPGPGDRRAGAAGAAGARFIPRAARVLRRPRVVDITEDGGRAACGDRQRYDVRRRTVWRRSGRWRPYVGQRDHSQRWRLRLRSVRRDGVGP
jgi:hypothetical protein